jgi:hypothetical protein
VYDGELDLGVDVRFDEKFVQYQKTADLLQQNDVVQDLVKLLETELVPHNDTIKPFVLRGRCLKILRFTWDLSAEPLISR